MSVKHIKSPENYWKLICLSDLRRIGKVWIIMESPSPDDPFKLEIYRITAIGWSLTLDWWFPIARPARPSPLSRRPAAHLGQSPDGMGLGSPTKATARCKSNDPQKQIYGPTMSNTSFELPQSRRLAQCIKNNPQTNTTQVNVLKSKNLVHSLMQHIAKFEFAETQLCEPSTKFVTFGWVMYCCRLNQPQVGVTYGEPVSPTEVSNNHLNCQRTWENEECHIVFLG